MMRWNSVSALTLLFLVCGVSAQTAQPWSGTYLYDGSGNIRAIGTNRYTYDGVNRLRSGTANTAVQQGTQTYAYDAYGNLVTLTHEDHSVLSVAVDRATNRADSAGACLSGSSCYTGTYDESGNQISFGSTTYAYDAANMLSETRSAQRDRINIYDADDERIAIVDDSGTQAWHYSIRDVNKKAIRLVDDTITGGTHAFAWKKDYVVRGSRYVASVIPDGGSEKQLHFHLDHLGTPRLITGPLGRTVAERTYWPYGAEAAGTTPDNEVIRFTGQERDSFGDGNDLDYMHARHRSATSTRFMAADPGPANSSSPQSWNRYAYSQSNPLKYVDASGQAITLSGDGDPVSVRDMLVRDIQHPTGRADLTTLAKNQDVLVVYQDNDTNSVSSLQAMASHGTAPMVFGKCIPVPPKKNVVYQLLSTDSIHNDHPHDRTGVWTVAHETVHDLGVTQGLTSNQLHAQDTDGSADARASQVVNEPVDMTYEEAEFYLQALLDMDAVNNQPEAPVRMTDPVEDDDLGLPIYDDY